MSYYQTLRHSKEDLLPLTVRFVDFYSLILLGHVIIHQFNRFCNWKTMWQMVSKTFERSVNSVPNNWPLSTVFIFITLRTGSAVHYKFSKKNRLIFRNRSIHKRTCLLTYLHIFQTFSQLQLKYSCFFIKGIDFFKIWDLQVFKWVGEKSI